MNKKKSRLRRAAQTRKKIEKLNICRLSVFRSNLHIYANVFSPSKDRIIVSASTLEPEIRVQLADKIGRGGNKTAAAIIGKRVAEKAIAAGIDSVAFDRSGFSYHGRIKELAESARQAGLKF
ncbi:MAG: 50S ribosomal protein L18 [Bordetella sp.]|nr:MAG: 50S ribosomal protein L18 [Bordetella sp.]